MTIPPTLLPPEWIGSGAVIAGGLDLLGLRLPTQAVGGGLVDGLTTVTPSVRYLGLRAWMIHRYGLGSRPDDLQAFSEFAARVESAIVLGNLLQDATISGLVGADEAQARLAPGKNTDIEISRLVKSPAAIIYTGPCDQLGISQSRGTALPALVIERGLPLAKAVDRRLAAVPIIDQILREPDHNSASVDELLQLGAVARIDRIPDDERDLLLDAILPATPRRVEMNRIRTYSALLLLARAHAAMPTERKFFEAACSIHRFGDPRIDPVGDGWTAYSVRDVIAVTQESILAVVMSEILGQPDAGKGGVDRGQAIASLVERVEEHDVALRGLGLLAERESVADLRFNGLEERVRTAAGVVAGADLAVKRWPGSLTEPQVYGLALQSGAGALSLAVVAWIIADLRVGDAVRENPNELPGLSHQGRRRLGLREVVLPELERFRSENRTVLEVAANMALRTVQQHLHITWSRSQVDPKRDVALLTAEGTKWFARGKGFAAGRTASRIQQGIGWLRQLGLIDSNGITAAGESTLQRAMLSLTTGQAG